MLLYRPQFRDRESCFRSLSTCRCVNGATNQPLFEFFTEVGLTSLLYGRPAPINSRLQFRFRRFTPPCVQELIGAVSMKMFRFIAVWLVGFQMANANASCVCRCVNGRMEPLCSSVADMRPFCPPSTLCPIAAPPTLAPLGPAIAPPVGTRSCAQRQILNPATGQYEWQSICR